jgi:hypothetical protein
MSDERAVSMPTEGHWLIRLVRNGPPVPACIRLVQTTVEPGEPTNHMERSPFLAAFINDEPVAIDRVWLVRGRPINEGEYRYRCAVTDWAIEHAPDTPEATPTKRVDLARIAPIYRRKSA